MKDPIHVVLLSFLRNLKTAILQVTLFGYFVFGFVNKLQCSHEYMTVLATD